MNLLNKKLFPYHTELNKLNPKLHDKMKFAMDYRDELMAEYERHLKMYEQRVMHFGHNKDIHYIDVREQEK